MYNFIVLGYVPGTSIQITFHTWLLLLVCLLIGLVTRELLIIHNDLLHSQPLRMPLHASQLHQRG